MEERYEIRGKIGQGGLGAVYRGYDTRMNREVAIKRISATTDDKSLQEESTRQLIKEAGALASLQHPHIVTIYDVGADEDGPYVVMELISGKTLDELIERAPLTWPDFRELSLQILEGLIAAQELDLIHSDLKPSNLMLTWLPSGKFQVKIVDFGLATLTHAQSKQDLEEMEAVFGSIFFMAPEQFERVPLDARTDMYAIGCVFYQALTGVYPFDGKTGMEVMNSHLQHQVTPLQDVRSDIPIWACDWIMWHLNRQPADRPETARDSLQVFLQNDKIPNPKLSRGTPQPSQPIHQQLPAGTRAAGPQPIRIPRPSTPATRIQTGQLIQPKDTTSQIPIPSVAPPTSALAQSEPVVIKTAPQPLLPPEGFKPSVHTSSHQLPDPTQGLAPAQVIASHTGPVRIVSTAPPPPEFLKSKKRKLGKTEKTVIASVLGIVALAAIVVIVKLKGSGNEQLVYDELIAEGSKDGATQVLVDRAKLEMLLGSIAKKEPAKRLPLYKTLSVAKAGDATDVDSRILDFTIKGATLPTEIKEGLIREVLRKRKNPAITQALIDFAKSATEPRLAAASLQAVRYTANEDNQFQAILEIVQSASNEDVRKAAEDTLAEIIRKNSHPNDLARKLSATYKSTTDENNRHALLRLLARCGGATATQLVKDMLSSPDPKNKIAAFEALAVWADDAAFPNLVEFIRTTQDQGLRTQAFDAAYRFVSEPGRSRNPTVTEDLWDQISSLASSPDEQKRVITGLTDYGSETWAYRMIDGFAKNAQNDPAVIQLAERTLNRLRGRN